MEDAIVELQRIVRAANSKYAIGLLFNISGAFDNVWWPSILASLKTRNCPRNLYSLIGSYLTDRKAKIVGATRSAEKKSQSGARRAQSWDPCSGT
ncbi:hypothetical protein QLX08_009342 [Tetragonisca angustula]|uniref:Reverse transcriptase domain-containing protein n=1 Tax=Tetragonisca angustula TaxID=166442 RepID=A0AAW0ZJ32_9HYME